MALEVICSLSTSLSSNQQYSSRPNIKNENAHKGSQFLTVFFSLENIKPSKQSHVYKRKGKVSADIA